MKKFSPRDRALFFVALLLTSCGYRPLNGTFPDGEGAVVIPLVGNTTSKSALSGRFTQSLRMQTAAAGIRVRGGGAPRLIVTIVAVTTGPGQLARDGDDLYPLDKIQTIAVVARVESEGGAILVPDQRFIHGGRSLAGQSAETEIALEAERRHGILDEIAAQIVEYMFFPR